MWLFTIRAVTIFSLFNKTSEIFKQNIPDEVIVSVFLGSSEHTAVVTSGGRYSNVIYVYDGSGKWLYTQRFIDDDVMQVAFSDDNRFIYVTRVTSDNGDIVTKLSKYDITGDGTELWTQTISDCVTLSPFGKRRYADRNGRQRNTHL